MLKDRTLRKLVKRSAALHKRRSAELRRASLPRWLRRVLHVATPGRVFAFVAAILIPTAGLLVTLADSDVALVDGGGAQMTPVLNRDRYGRVVSGTALINIPCWFENRGLKPGHIERLEVRSFPPSDEYKMDVHYVDRTSLRWHERKLLHFELVVTMTKPKKFNFELAFIDGGGREVGRSRLAYSIDIEPYKNGTVVGTVVAADTGELLSGVTVTLETPGNPKIMLTDTGGNALVENVPPGSYRLRTRLQGYEEATTAVQMLPGKHAEFKVKMNRSHP